MVAIGVALEGAELVHDVSAYVLRKKFEKRDLTSLKELGEFAPIRDQKVSPFTHPQWLHKLERWAKRFGRIGLILVVIGVVGEWIYGDELNDAQNALHKLDITELTLAEEKAGDAARSATTAREESAVAKSDADAAKKSAGEAESESGNAQRLAQNAESSANSAATTSTKAKHEADSATEELNRIKASRGLFKVPDLIASMRAFSDTEYKFSAVCAEDECIQLLKQIDGTLSNAGWKRDDSLLLSTGPIIDIYGDHKVIVPESLSRGVQISTQSPEVLAAIQARPPESWPPHIRAAAELNLGIKASLYPPQEGIGLSITVENGTSTVVRISVGKKP
jgi:hypothetical protein